MARALDPAELLGVDVQQIAWRVVLVTVHGLNGLQVTQLGETRTREHPADRGLRHAYTARDLHLQQAPTSQLDDQQRLGRLDGTR